MQAEKVAINIPQPPNHFHALEPIPDQVLDEWKSSYERALALTAGADGPSAHAVGLAEANRLIKVEEPKSHAEALAIPDWQVMKREEISFRDLPQHARRELARSGHSGSCEVKYLRVYTTDGKEHFFPIPK